MVEDKVATNILYNTKTQIWGTYTVEFFKVINVYTQRYFLIKEYQLWIKVFWGNRLGMQWLRKSL